MKKIIKGILMMFGALTVVMGLTLQAESLESTKEEGVPKKVYMAVIIDDFGNQMAGTDAIANLPIPLTGAVIPGMPFAKEDANTLHAAGKEVIIHVPLEPINGKPNWLGPKGITTGMGEEKVKANLEDALEEIPYAVGMNNHMGSRAMQSKMIVSTMMDFANEKGFYFVDSKTYDNKIAAAIAEEKHTTYMMRDIFLDNTPTTEHAIGQLQA
ncbi:MAG: divergent polysaccharide deacetylase family protein, partial [Niameybacter sp.]